MSVVAVQTEKGIAGQCFKLCSSESVLCTCNPTAMDYQTTTAQNAIQGQHAIYPQGSLISNGNLDGTVSGTSINIGAQQTHTEHVPFMGGWNNGFNLPPKDYVLPSAEEIKTFLEKLHETGQLEKLNISIDGNDEPITSPNMFPNIPQAGQQGWECPRCKDINAPFVNKCGCK